MNLGKILGKVTSNIKHIPSTLAGAIIGVVSTAAVAVDPSTPVGQAVQSLTAGNPRVAAVVGLITCLGLIFGVGKPGDKSDRSSKSSKRT